MNRHLRLAAAALALLTIPAAVALAAGPPDHVRTGAPKSAEAVRQHMATVADRALDEIDATDAQRAEFDAVLDDAAVFVFEHRKAVMMWKREVKDVLTADTVDRVRLEQLRVVAIERADDGSKILVDTLADLAEVLTPDQRAELADAAEQWHREHGAPFGR